MPVLRPISGRRYPGVARSWGLLVVFGASSLCASERALAASEAKERTITSDEVVSWLDRSGDTPPLSDSGAEDEALAPPPAPRHRGFVVESGIGAFGQIG